MQAVHSTVGSDRYSIAISDATAFSWFSQLDPPGACVSQVHVAVLLVHFDHHATSCNEYTALSMSCRVAFLTDPARVVCRAKLQ